MRLRLRFWPVTTPLHNLISKRFPKDQMGPFKKAGHVTGALPAYSGGPQQYGGQWTKGRGVNAFENDYEEDGLDAHEEPGVAIWSLQEESEVRRTTQCIEADKEIQRRREELKQLQVEMDA